VENCTGYVTAKEVAATDCRQPGRPRPHSCVATAIHDFMVAGGGSRTRRKRLGPRGAYGRYPQRDRNFPRRAGRSPGMPELPPQGSAACDDPVSVPDGAQRPAAVTVVVSELAVPRCANWTNWCSTTRPTTKSIARSSNRFVALGNGANGDAPSSRAPWGRRGAILISYAKTQDVPSPSAREYHLRRGR